MRTLDDLQGAFALLEYEADEYAASHDEVLVSPADVITLSAASPRRRRVRPALWATAAAVAAAVTAGSLVVINPLGSPNPAVKGTPTEVTPPPPALLAAALAVPFRLDTSAGLQILGASATQYGVGADLASASHRFLVLVATPPQKIAVGPPTLPQVFEISGAKARFAGPTSTDPKAAYTLSWTRADGRFVEVTTSQRGTTPGLLVGVARALDFGGKTEVRSSIGLSVAPRGMHMINMHTSYHWILGQDGLGEPPYATTSPAWHTDLGYAPVVGNGLDIEAGTVPGVTASTDGAKAVEVSLGAATTASHGFWSQRGRGLTLELGAGVYLNISEVRWTSSSTLSYDDLANVARSVTVVAHPENRSSWLDASQALPLGS